MRTGRPPKAENPYKIIIHNNGGKRYASTKIIVAQSQGKKVYRHQHWGSIDVQNIFHPNRLYMMTPSGERDKLIFPEWVDMSEAQRLTNKLDLRAAKTETSPTTIILPSQTWLYGDVWLLEQVLKGSRLNDDLLKTFSDNREIAQGIQTIAI